MSFLRFHRAKEDESDKLPRSASQLSDRYETVREGLLRLGLVTRWDPECAQALQVRTMVNVAAREAGCTDTGFGTYNKASLAAICKHLGLPVTTDMTTRDMRHSIADKCGFVYNSPDSRIRNFRAPEHRKVVMEVLERSHKQK